MLKPMENHKRLLRWLSMVPTMFTTFVLSDWIIRLAIWLIVLPMEIFEKVFGAGFIGDFIDNIVNRLVGIDFMGATTIAALSFVTGYMMVFIPTIISPSNKKNTAIILTAVYLFLIGGAFFVSIIKNGFVAAYILGHVFNLIGILSALDIIRKQTDEKDNKYEGIILNNTIRIFVVTSLFTVIMSLVFLYLWSR